jgi:hypothetical protein
VEPQQLVIGTFCASTLVMQGRLQIAVATPALAHNPCPPPELPRTVPFNAQAGTF